MMTDDPASEAPILLVVDDDESVRRALWRLLSAAGYAVETFATAQELLEREPLTVAGCLILDVHLPGLSGLELHDLLRSTGMEKATIFISGEEDVSSSIRAMKSGAIDFLTKPIDANELLPAVERAIARDRAIRSVDAELSVLRRRAARLTPRETEVCALVASGRLNKQIAAVLGTSAKTVKVHRARVMTKLEVHSLPELVRVADRLGLKHPRDVKPSEKVESERDPPRLSAP
jgi:FixJ family two-component response regulator